MMKRLPKKQSIGIACCRYNPKTNRPEILLVQKRYSYNFQTFVFGYYRNNNKTLKKLFDGMTKEEKLDILSGNFELLWFKVFLRFPIIDRNFYIEGQDSIDSCKVKNHHKMYKTKYHVRREQIKIKNWKSDYKRKSDSFDIPSYTDYDQEESYFYVQKCKYDKLFENEGRSRLLSLINQSLSISLLWEIPKGRKNKDESDISCAMREFTEETSVIPEAYKIIMDKPISNNHISENICYVYKYFIAAFDNRYFNERFDKNILKLTEIIDTKWVSLEVCEMLENDRGRLYRLCKRILKIFKKKIKNPFEFGIYDRIEQCML